MTKDEALKLALEALEATGIQWPLFKEAITAIREASAQPDVDRRSTESKETFDQQEPVAWVRKHPDGAFTAEFLENSVIEPVRKKSGAWFPLYTTPPAQRKPLTDERKDAARWRFLVDNSFDKEGVTQFHVWEHSWAPHSQTGEPTEWKQRVRGIALIDFIDRAIEAAHGIKE